MNSGNSVQDPDLHSASADAAAEGPGKLGTESQDPEGPQDRLTGMPSGARSPLQHLQDIQEIVDKLAAVT
jgi:hypothetical protein